MSFVQKLQQQSGGKGISYVWGPDATGKAAWYYVKVPPPKQSAFEKAVAAGCTLTDYGEIIKSAYGEHAPDSVRTQMKEEYGFEHSDS